MSKTPFLTKEATHRIETKVCKTNDFFGIDSIQEKTFLKFQSTVRIHRPNWHLSCGTSLSVSITRFIFSFTYPKDTITTQDCRLLSHRRSIKRNQLKLWICTMHKPVKSKWLQIGSPRLRHQRFLGSFSYLITLCVIFK